MGSDKNLKYSRAFDSEIVFESYGVRVKIQATDAELLKKAEQTASKALLNRLRIIESKDTRHTFGFADDGNGTLTLFLNEVELASDSREHLFFKFFNSMLRIVVAEHAEERVFIHAGVVGWKDRAIVIPANSFHGKTTLVAELVKSGAEYYSDEYAVLDAEGLVHPFPRDLSVRDDDFAERDVPVEELGGISGSKAIPVGAVLLTMYEKNMSWQPDRLTIGQGIMEVIPHTIPINLNAEFSLKVLNTALSDAIILKGRRGEASTFAPEFLSFFDDIAGLT